MNCGLIDGGCGSNVISNGTAVTPYITDKKLPKVSMNILGSLVLKKKMILIFWNNAVTNNIINPSISGTCKYL